MESRGMASELREGKELSRRSKLRYAGDSWRRIEERSNDGEIGKMGACTNDGFLFSGIIRTSVRSNKSPMLESLRADVWNMLVDSRCT